MQETIKGWVKKSRSIGSYLTKGGWLTDDINNGWVFTDEPNASEKINYDAILVTRTTRTKKEEGQ